MRDKALLILLAAGAALLVLVALDRLTRDRYVMMYADLTERSSPYHATAYVYDRHEQALYLIVGAGGGQLGAKESHGYAARIPDLPQR